MSEKINCKEEKPVKYVNSNIPLLEEHHFQLRILALQQGRTLRDMLTEIISNYLDCVSSKDNNN